MSYVVCRMSYVMCHMSYVICQMSYDICHMSYVIWHGHTFQSSPVQSSPVQSRPVESSRVLSSPVQSSPQSDCVSAAVAAAFALKCRWMCFSAAVAAAFDVCCLSLSCEALHSTRVMLQLTTEARMHPAVPLGNSRSLLSMRSTSAENPI